MATNALPMPTIADSTSSMWAALPDDIFSGTDDISPTGAEAGDDPEEPEEEPQDQEVDTEDVEPAEEEAFADTEPEAEPAPETKDAKADEELPEGVRKGKDSKGKEKYFLEENRYQTFHGNHKLVQQAGELLNEPLTLDGIKLRDDALQLNERLFTDLASGDPASQGNVVDFILNEMKSAHESGEVGIDPAVPFVEQIYTKLRDNAPDAYAHLRMMAAKDFLTEMFEVAANTSDRNLEASAQRMALTLANVGAKPEGMTDEQYIAKIREVTGAAGVPFYAPGEAPKATKNEDPIAKLQRENAELRAKISNPTSTTPAEQFGTWRSGNIKAVNSAVMDEVVKPSLSSVKDAWKEFPSEYDDMVVGRLNRLVAQDVKADVNFNGKIATLTTKAGRAASEQVRADIGEQIKAAFINRAKFAADKHKPAVLKFAAESLKGRSDATHERRNGAQSRTAPKGTSAPVRRSLANDTQIQPGGVFDSKAQATNLAKLLAGVNR